MNKLLKSLFIFGLGIMTSNLHSQQYSDEQAQEKLHNIGQSHLLKYWDHLDGTQKRNLLKEIESLDSDAFHMQQKVLNSQGQNAPFTVEPFHKVLKWEEGSYAKSGLQALQQGKVGVAIVAGGQGTRFGYDGPKGCYPTSQVKNKSLFQLFAEKVLYASIMADVELPLAIMTSSNNHEDTVQFFKSHDYFGLNKQQVSFFQQDDLPFIDTSGNLFLQSSDTIAKGPNGNGAFYQHFVGSGIWEKWNNRGIDTVNFILIDNPLADPFDLELIGCHHSNNNHVTIKCIEREDPYEKVGVIVADDNQNVHVLEYTEIEEEQRLAKDSNGQLVHECANISLFCFDMAFVKTVAENSAEFLPYHLAFKATKYLNEKGESVKSKEPIANKYERFIFDILPYATNVNALVYPREECFSPLKNPSGNNSPETVKNALLAKDCKQWTKITQTAPPEQVFELSQAFYYPTAAFRQQWEGVEAPNLSYIEQEVIK
jgi:UDP-N-acetylglucosamine/UDP-N-acetylgalactosamine diphosphorylase